MPIDPDDYTKEELQEMARSFDLPVSGTKDEIAERLVEHTREQPTGEQARQPEPEGERRLPGDPPKPSRGDGTPDPEGVPV